eukprot:scaffold5613_cov133-Isochrysis_galbana.AAC.11
MSACYYAFIVHVRACAIFSPRELRKAAGGGASVRRQSGGTQTDPDPAGTGALDSKTVVSDSSQTGSHSQATVSESFAVAIWLTMLPCAESRGRFGDEWMSMTVSFGSEAEGAARASAGNVFNTYTYTSRAVGRAKGWLARFLGFQPHHKAQAARVTLCFVRHVAGVICRENSRMLSSAARMRPAGSRVVARGRVAAPPSVRSEEC